MLRIAAVTLALIGIAAAADPQNLIAEQVPAARAILEAWRGKQPPTAERKLHLVYWTPRDREPAKETIVIFCNMSNWDAEKKTISQNSPYYAGGTHRNGTAWQVDSPILDLALLDDNEPRVRDGQYGRISIGRYNSIFIGGVCHELGHAIGMPHNRQNPAEGALWGTALMGAGNRTYGEDLRNEGKGSFLTLAHGLRLASHPMFSGVVKDIDTRPKSEITDVALKPGDKSFQLTARVTGTPPVYAVLGYMDPQGGGDYDATTCTAIPAKDGTFTLNCDALKAGKSAVLRLVTLHANGAASSFAGSGARLSFPYAVARDGTPDLSTARAALVLRPLIDALNKRSGPNIEAALTQLEQTEKTPVLLETARTLAATAGSADRIEPATTERNPLPLADARWSAARVGWGRPATNCLPDPNPLFIAGSRLFPRGIYAHAPSSYSYQLGGKWKTLSGHAGLADGHRGTVSFRITGDGRELWRSPLVKPGQLLSFDVKLKAPRFDKDGNKTANAVFVEVRHNGKLVHENQEVTGPTRAAGFNDEKPTGPLMFQGDHGPVAYRKLRIRPL